MLDINERLNNLEARLLDIEIRLGMIAPANTGPPRGAAARSTAPIATAGPSHIAAAGPAHIATAGPAHIATVGAVPIGIRRRRTAHALTRGAARTRRSGFGYAADGLGRRVRLAPGRGLLFEAGLRRGLAHPGAADHSRHVGRVCSDRRRVIFCADRSRLRGLSAGARLDHPVSRILPAPISAIISGAGKPPSRP